MNPNDTEEKYFWKDYPKVNKFRHFGRFGDVIIHVQDEVFHCHRVLLASMSEYFDAMLGGDFKEGNTAEVVLHDVDAVIIGTMLDFMYTGHLPEINNDNIYDLFLASDFYGLDDLKAACNDFMDEHLPARRISSINIVKLFSLARSSALANDTSVAFLKEHVLTHLAAFTQTKGFLEMPYEDLSVVLTDYRKSASSSVPFENEDFLLHGLILWMRHAYDARKRHFEALVDKLDFEKISAQCARSLANDNPVDEMETVLRARIERVRPSAVAESAKSPTPHQYLPFDRKATIHIYLSIPVHGAVPDDSLDEYNIYTMNEQKAKPDWYLSGSFHVPRKPPDSRRPLTFIASEKLDFVYALHHYYAKKKGPAEFIAYSSTDFRNPRKLTIGSPMRDFCKPSLGVKGNRIYMYNPDVHDYLYWRSCDVNKDFSFDEYSRGVYSYNCDIDKWYPVPQMKRRLAFAGLVTDTPNNLVYLIGGTDIHVQIPWGYVQAYDDRAPDWFEVCKSTYYYSEHASCCSAEGKIYVTDGYAVEVYDPVAGKWNTITCPFSGNSRKVWPPMWMVPYENRVYAFHKMLSSLWILDPFLMEWSTQISFENALDIDPDLDECCSLHNVQNVIVFKPTRMWDDSE